MKVRARLSRFGALAVLALMVAALLPSMTPPAAAATPIRVMLMGDSITRGDSRFGSSGIATFRYYLWKQLMGAGYNVDFVGSEVGVNPEPDNPQGLPLFPDFDQDNEGHSAYWARRFDGAIDPVDGDVMDLYSNAARWVSQSKANVVLLHIGTNDLRFGTNPSSIRDNVRSVISQIRIGNPSAAILLAQIIPTGGWDVSPFNSLLPAVASSMSTAQSPVILVDQYTGFSLGSDTIDTIHPNASGEQKMASRWFAALTGLLGVAPGTLPDAPSKVVATPGDRSATVSWTPPSGQDAALISSYTVTPSADAAAVTVPASTTSTAISGLTNGKSYTFNVTATNPVGTSTPASSGVVIPGRPPDAPTAVTATAGNGSVTVGWTGSAGTGGYPITAYVVAASPGGSTATAAGNATSAIVTGLSNGQTYTFTVTGQNALGTGAASVPSPAVSPGTVPAAPTGVAAVAGDRAATVTWATPSTDGGRPISSYTVTAAPGGRSATVTSPATSGSVSGLTDGVSYTFAVTATNSLGTGPASGPSPAVVPASVPGAPTGLAATPGSTSVQISWAPPVDDGGRSVTGYAVTTSPGDSVVTTPPTVTAVIVPNLTNGVAYTFSVKALNTVGTSSASAAVTARPLPVATFISPLPTPRVASGPRLSLLSLARWGPDGDGRFHVAGEVRNDDSVVATQISVGLAVYDAAGTVLASPVVDMPVLGLAPGDRSPFEATLDLPNGFDHLDLPWISSTAGGVRNHEFVTTITGTTTDANGARLLTGTVVNRGLTSAATPSIVATLTNSDVAVGTAPVLLPGVAALAAGASAPFSLVVPPDRPVWTDVRLIGQSPTAATPPPTGVHEQGAGAPADGYWLVASDGGIFSFGNRQFHGSTGAIHLNKPIVGMASTASDLGYWLVASDGGIFAFGDATFFGSTGAIHLNKPIVGMAPTPSGNGYWLVASDGGIFAFGDAGFFGSTGAIQLNKPIVGMASTPSGRGYWLVASDGGVFAFGDAGFFGSTGALHLAQPIVGMASTVTGAGYRFVAADGGVFTFGDATFAGSAGGGGSSSPVVGITDSGTGGYWLASADGNVLPFGSVKAYGNLSGIPLSRPIVGISP